MGVFDGYTSILFREDASGRRVYAPFGTWGGVSEVPNAEARRIQRQVKIFWAAWLVLDPRYHSFGARRVLRPRSLASSSSSPLASSGTGGTPSFSRRASDAL